MIIAVCADKGQPGVTTLATALGCVWPGRRVLLEADPSGGDLMFRAHAHGSQFLAEEPSVLSLALDARPGAGGSGLDVFAQLTTLGVPVIPGPPHSEEWAPMRSLWEPMTLRATAWDGTVIVDLGRLQPGHPGLPLVQAADVVLLLARASVEGLSRVRWRTRELSLVLQEADQPRNRVGVVVRAGRQDARALDEVRQMLGALGSLVPVVGGFADDPEGVKDLSAGVDSASLRKTALLRSAADLAERIQRTWPVPGLRTAAASPVPVTHGSGARRQWRGQGR